MGRGNQKADTRNQNQQFRFLVSGFWFLVSASITLPTMLPAPILLSTWRFGLPANAAGWPHLQRPGGLLDALEQTCIACELDPHVNSVGVGGLPDSSGIVSLDGAIMLSPAQSAGVGYLRGYPHPVSVARRVMEKTPHKLLVGDGAERFAAAEGFATAQLLTEPARARWQEWKRTGQSSIDPHAYNPPLLVDDGRNPPHDTIGVLAIDASGAIGAACSTSGRAFKLPGRVGDSPLIGHGLYCDPKAGAAVATGTGELMIGVAASFLIVERMRMGDRPIEAVRYVLNRVIESYPNLGETDQCALIALGIDGKPASGAVRPGFEVAITTPQGGARLIPPDVVVL
jgi:L-asparaginase/N4-(beta-N-acetylglucosaminyl)-L-asparaginase